MTLSRQQLRTKLLASLALSRASLATVQTGAKISRAFASGKQDPTDPQLRAEIQNWARKICRAFDVRVTVRGEAMATEAGLLVGNHMSYMDIPVLMSMEPLSFVAKAEVRSWPIIGPAAAGFGVIFIERNSDKSRKDTGETLRKAVLENKRRVVVFPEGTTSLRGLPWRAGVFKLAQEHQLPMQVMSICYRPAEALAFESPSMLEHAMKLPEAAPIEAIVSFSPSFYVKDFLKDFGTWENWSKQALATELRSQGIL
jgi:1-acyl-sn-glycerol-3-phosphate acyltransferase